MEDILSTPVLVLNKYFSAIDTTTVKEALTKLWAGAVEAVVVSDAGAYESYGFHAWAELSAYRELFEDVEMINTPQLELMVPRVIRTVHYDRMQTKKLQPTRRNIYDRDAHTCQYCNKRRPIQELNLDHVIPQCQGGRSTWLNLVCACIRCNSKKGGRTPKEAGMTLRRAPFMPSVSYKIGIPAGARRHYKSWQSFVDFQYWNTPLDE